MKWVMYLLSKVSKAGNLVLNTSAATLYTLKACLLLPEQRRYVRSEKSSVWFQDALPSLADVYEKKVLSPPSTMTGNQEVE